MALTVRSTGTPSTVSVSGRPLAGPTTHSSSREHLPPTQLPSASAPDFAAHGMDTLHLLLGSAFCPLTQEGMWTHSWEHFPLQFGKHLNNEEAVPPGRKVLGWPLLGWDTWSPGRSCVRSPSCPLSLFTHTHRHRGTHITLISQYTHTQEHTHHMRAHSAGLVREVLGTASGKNQLLQQVAAWGRVAIDAEPEATPCR